MQFCQYLRIKIVKNCFIYTCNVYILCKTLESLRGEDDGILSIYLDEKSSFCDRQNFFYESNEAGSFAGAKRGINVSEVSVTRCGWAAFSVCLVVVYPLPFRLAIRREDLGTENHQHHRPIVFAMEISPVSVNKPVARLYPQGGAKVTYGGQD